MEFLLLKSLGGNLYKMVELIIKRKKPKFKRTDFSKYSKLGVRRKKKQVYRKAKGIDNKIRLKMKGHPRRVMIGFRTAKKTRGLVNGLVPVRVNNINDLKLIKNNEIGIIAKIGKKKKIQLAEYALEHKIKLDNLNAKVFLENINKELEKTKKEKQEREEKIKARDKEKKDKEKKDKEKKEEKSKQDEKKEEASSDKSEGSKSAEESSESKSDKKETKTENNEKIKSKDENKKQIQTNNYGRGK